MGVDVNLYSEADPSPERLNAANERFKTLCWDADEYVNEATGEVIWHALQYDDGKLEGRPPRVTANINTRYYGPGYERGNWAAIYGAIRILQSLFPEAKVFYGGDSVDDGVECTSEFLEGIWLHLLGPQGDAYREYARARNARFAPANLPYPPGMNPNDPDARWHEWEAGE